jgi:hypothetical protein
LKINSAAKILQDLREYATAFPNVLWACRTPTAWRTKPSGQMMKVTLEVVERIMRLRRLGRRVADIGQLCGLSELTVRKVLSGTATKKSATETQETGTEIDRED